MRHTIPVETLGPQGPAMAAAVAACVHCGFCLAPCPTYRLLGEEMDSPRGRIVLMKDVLEGNLAAAEALPFIDRCLGCQACVPACPSGVAYGELLMPFRGLFASKRRRSKAERLQRWLLHTTLPYPGRFRVAIRAGRLVKAWRNRLPAAWRPLLDLLPAALPAAEPLPAVYPALGRRRARVALLAGCVQQVLNPGINWATLRVLRRNGVEVVVPPRQGCCGALAIHAGETRRAQALARANVRAFADGFDAVITNAAGCGSGMHEYPLLLAGSAEEEAARRLAARTKDISAFLDQLGLDPAPPPLPQPLRVAYHDACHLAHAQGVREAPRRLLRQIPNLTLLEIPEADQCCGSAGTYNLEHPDLAAQLGARKAQAILSTGAEALVTGNIGCMVQIEAHLRRNGHPLPIYHTVQLLDQAYTAGAV